MSDLTSSRLEQWRRWTDAPLLLIALGSLPILVLEVFHGDLSSGDQRVLRVYNWGLLIAFGLDYTVKLTLTRDRVRFVRGEWLNLVVVISQGLVVADTLSRVGFLRALRGLRALRPILQIARVFAFTGAAAAQSRSALRRNAAGYAFGLAVLTWLSSAVAFSFAEDVGEHGRAHVQSFGDALWWSATTMATVGYGDIAPQTSAGRAVAVVTMVIGISVFATLTAKVAEFLVRGDLQRPDEPEPTLEGRPAAP